MDWVLIAVCGAVALISWGLSWWFGRHPFRKADRKTEKYRYKSNF